MTVLVAGATGRQGGAVARELLRMGHRVRALTRNAGNDAAQRLGADGADLVEGDLLDDTTLREPMQGADAFFLVTTPYETGVEDEVQQGRTGVESAKEFDVPYVVMTSVADADRETGIPHFDSKATIERHLQKSGVAHAIVAPVWFRENLLAPSALEGLQEGRLPLPLPVDRDLQTVEVAEIGRFGAKAVAQRDAFEGQRVNLASDAVSPAAMAKALGDVLNRPIEAQEVPVEDVARQSEDMARMFAWFRDVGYSADIEGLRRDHGDVPWRGFRAWAQEQPWNRLLARPVPR